MCGDAAMEAAVRGVGVGWKVLAVAGAIVRPADASDAIRLTLEKQRPFPITFRVDRPVDNSRTSSARASQAAEVVAPTVVAARPHSAPFFMHDAAIGEKISNVRTNPTVTAVRVFHS